MAKISRVWAREILDSRGIPTVEAACMLDTGTVTVASVPAGTSTGTHEALELRDTENPRYLGKGVWKAVNNVNTILGPAILGMDPMQQAKIDEKLISTDGTENKSKYGANAILATSIAVAKAGALAAQKDLYIWIYYLAQLSGLKPAIKVPIPLFNMINGGLHGAGNLDFQEFHVIPASTKSFAQGIQMGAEIYMMIGDNLARRGAIHSVGNEGGYAPNLFTNADALEVFIESIKQTQYSMGRDVFLGLDVAANSFYSGGEYQIRDKSSPMNSTQIMEFYKALNDQYHLAILEDPLAEDAFEEWAKLTELLGPQVTIVGDDLLATNPKRLQKAITEKSCNAILIKPNQIGTVTETLKVIKMARDANFKVIVSHRSGETNDWFIADFATGVGADYCKFGAPARGERVAKYNRLSAIEVELSRYQK
jgi:enolase